MLRSKSDYWGDKKSLVYRDAVPFQATLAFEMFSFGASAKLVQLIDTTTNDKYVMQLRHFEKQIPHLEEGKLTGRFKYQRGGQYWNVEYVAPTPIELLAMQAD